MTAGVVGEVSQLILAIAAVIIAIALLLLVARKGFKGMTAEFGKAKVSLEAVNQKVDSVLEKAEKIQATSEKVNAAVNNVPEGTATLVERVGTLEQGHQDLLNHQRWEADAIVQIARQVGVTTLTEPPIERRYPPITGETPIIETTAREAS